MNGRRSTSREVLALVVVTIVGLAGARVVSALFTSTVPVAVNAAVSTPIIPPPATVTCQTQGLPIVSRWAQVSWTAPAGGVVPSAYVIRARNSAGVATEVQRVSGTTLTATVSSGLLVGGLSWLLGLIVGNQNPPFTVNAVYGAYESPTNYRHYFRADLGLLSGIGCEPLAAPLAAPAAVVATTTTATTTMPTAVVTPSSTAVATTAAPAPVDPSSTTIASSTLPTSTTETTATAAVAAPTSVASTTTLVPPTTVAVTAPPSASTTSPPG